MNIILGFAGVKTKMYSFHKWSLSKGSIRSVCEGLSGTAPHVVKMHIQCLVAFVSHVDVSWVE